MKEIRVGSVCYDDECDLGVVTRFTPNVNKLEILDGVKYVGVRFDGTPWFSKNPTLCAKNIDEYLELYEREIRGLGKL